MADYIYLLENRLSLAQQRALQHVRDAARAKAMNVFLAGGAVRDLTSGSPVRDLDVSVQGNAIKLKKDLEKVGGLLAGEHEPSQTLFFKFPGGVRMEVSSTRTETYPKPGKPVYHPADLKQDLYRRDFTANAMALSLNEGSYGLLIDPMNGVADIESRYLRLVSNYGFIEDPSRLVRAARLAARLGWQMDEKTKARYLAAKEENYISALPDYSRGYELEEIVHEEDPLRALKALEDEGWMKHLFPAWTVAKANAAGLQELHNTLMRLQMQGVTPDASAANFYLLTAKLAEKDIAALKKFFVRQGFVKEIESLDHDAKEFSKLLLSKDTAAPSATWKLLTSYPAEAVLWLAYTSKNAAVQTKFNNFFVVWPEARQKYPYLLMQEMRITPDLPAYQGLLQSLFFEMMDGKLQTPEEMRAYLEPYSPPAPPPPVHLRRPRAVKKAEPKPSRKKAAAAAAKAEEEAAMIAGGIAAVAEVPSAMPAKPKSAKKPAIKAEAAAKQIEPAAPVKAAKAIPAKKPAVKPEPAKPASVAKTVPVKAQKAAVAKPLAIAKKAAPVKGSAKPVLKKAVAPAKAVASRPVSAKVTSAKPSSIKVAAKKAVPAKAAVKTAAKKPLPAIKKQAAGKKSIPGKAIAGKAAKPATKKAVKTAPHKPGKPSSGKSRR